MLVIDLVLFGLPGLAMCAVQMVWIPFWAAGVINGIGHYWGYRNFETQDASTQHHPLGRADRRRRVAQQPPRLPDSAKLAQQVVGARHRLGLYPGARELGLADVKRVAPRTAFAPGKSAIDVETLRAVWRTASMCSSSTAGA